MKYRKASAVFVLLTLIASYCAIYSPPKSSALPVQDLVVAEMISKISESEIHDTVLDLQNFIHRGYGHPGNAAAATYLYNRFNMIPGLVVVYQGTFNNTIATLTGIDAASDETYMIGAHYDSTSSTSYAPGATDDGGGVALVLEFARIMSQYRFDHTIKFALWNAEENGMLGSNNYVQSAYSSGQNISLYMNLDSACYDPDNRLILDIMYDDQSMWVSDLMTGYNTLYDIDFTLTYNVHTCGSDHRPFWQYGYTAAMTHAESHGPAHTEYDTVDKVSTVYAKKNGQLVMSVLASLAEAQNPHVGDPDIGITSGHTSKTVIAKGSNLTISLTIFNYGKSTESFNLTVYANATAIYTAINLVLATKHTATIDFYWNTSNFARAYAISATIPPLEGETCLFDNTLTLSVVRVTCTGDVNGDYLTDLKDYQILKNHIPSFPGSLNWDPNTDVNNDLVVDVKDFQIIRINTPSNLP